jgi:zinc protease
MGTRPENLETAEEGMAAEMRRLSEEPPTAEEVATAVNARVGRMRMRRMTRMGQAFYLCMDLLGGDPLLEHDRRLQAMQTVTPEDVARMSKRYIDPARANRVIVR